MPDPFETIIFITVCFASLFTLFFYQVYYLHSILDNKPVSRSLEKYFSIISMIIVVLLGIILLLILIGTPIAADNSLMVKFIPFVIIGGILALYLYNFIIINKGEHPARGAIITNLIILYPCLIAIGICFLATLYSALK